VNVAENGCLALAYIARLLPTGKAAVLAAGGVAAVAAATERHVLGEDVQAVLAAAGLRG
jgi:hypothetical protein